MSCLYVVVPGLFGPFPAAALQGSGSMRRLRVETLLARAEPEAFPGVDADAVLFRLFGGQRAAGEDIPHAAISRLADGAAAADGWWMHADPVFLRADRDRLLLFAGDRLDIEAAEAQQLADLCNAHFQQRDWELEVACPQHWYVKLQNDPMLQTRPLSEVVGRNIDAFLPAGPGARDWRCVMNEVQMLFHSAQTNRRRAARGVPAVNSLWFWGSGKAPPHLPARFSAVYAEGAFARGLAGLAGTPAPAFPEDAGRLVNQGASGDRLLLIQGLHRHVLDADFAAWKNAVEHFDDHWMQPLYQALRNGRIPAMRIFPGNGYSYYLNRRGLLRFWRTGASLVNQGSELL